MTVARLTAAELAERWGLTEKWLRNQRWLGKGPPFEREGGRVYYPLHGVRDFERRKRRRRT